MNSEINHNTIQLNTASNSKGITEAGVNQNAQANSATDRTAITTANLLKSKTFWAQLLLGGLATVAMAATIIMMCMGTMIPATIAAIAAAALFVSIPLIASRDGSSCCDLKPSKTQAKDETPSHASQTLNAESGASSQPDEVEKAPIQQPQNTYSEDYQALSAAIDAAYTKNAGNPIILDSALLTLHRVTLSELLELITLHKGKIEMVDFHNTLIELNIDNILDLFTANPSIRIRPHDFLQFTCQIGRDLDDKLITREQEIKEDGKRFIQRFKFTIRLYDEKMPFDPKLEDNFSVTCDIKQYPAEDRKADAGPVRPEGLSDDAWAKLRAGHLVSAEDGSVVPAAYLMQFDSRDIPVILMTYGPKFKQVMVPLLGSSAPELDFSSCVHAERIILSDAAISKITGLSKC